MSRAERQAFAEMMKFLVIVLAAIGPLLIGGSIASGGSSHWDAGAWTLGLVLEAVWLVVVVWLFVRHRKRR